MTAEGRQAEIVRALRTSESVSVATLARELQTSEVTIRRDLAELEQTGVLRRVRGGAVGAALRGDEMPFAMRELESAAEKDRIAAAAVGLIADAEAVVVDSGTTGLAAARHLAARRVTAMPLSVGAISVLSAAPAVSLLLPGGTVRPGELSVVGPLTEQCLAELRFDTVLLTCCGLASRPGVTAHDLQDAAVKRRAIASAARVVAMVDASKFSRTAMAVVCPITALDIVVTDHGAPPEEVAALRAAGVEVLCV